MRVNAKPSTVSAAPGENNAKKTKFGLAIRKVARKNQPRMLKSFETYQAQQTRRVSWRRQMRGSVDRLDEKTAEQQGVAIE